MSAEGKFLVFALRCTRRPKNLTGKEVISLFKRYGVSDYVLSCYEALHTTGTNYIVEDIDLYLEARQHA